jgi:hypothetical protein
VVGLCRVIPFSVSENDIEYNKQHDRLWSENFSAKDARNEFPKTSLVLGVNQRRTSPPAAIRRSWM